MRLMLVAMVVVVVVVSRPHTKLEIGNRGS